MYKINEQKYNLNLEEEKENRIINRQNSVVSKQ